MFVVVCFCHVFVLYDATDPQIVRLLESFGFPLGNSMVYQIFFYNSLINFFFLVLFVFRVPL